jgi:hypothetical protein
MIPRTPYGSLVCSLLHGWEAGGDLGNSITRTGVEVIERTLRVPRPMRVFIYTFGLTTPRVGIPLRSDRLRAVLLCASDGEE